MVSSNVLHHLSTQGSTQKQAAMEAWMTREQRHIRAGGSAKPGRRSHWGQRDVQCSRCTQRQTGDMEAGLRFRQIQSGLEAASSWSYFVCPHSLIYPLIHTRPTLKSAANLDVSEGLRAQGGYRPRSLLQTLASSSTAQVWTRSGSYSPVCTLSQTRCWAGSCVSSWR